MWDGVGSVVGRNDETVHRRNRDGGRRGREMGMNISNNAQPVIIGTSRRRGKSMALGVIFTMVNQNIFLTSGPDHQYLLYRVTKREPYMHGMNVCHVFNLVYAEEITLNTSRVLCEIAHRDRRVPFPLSASPWPPPRPPSWTFCLW